MTGGILHLKGPLAACIALSGCTVPTRPLPPASPPAPVAPTPAPFAAPDAPAAPVTDPASLAGTRWVLIEAGGERVPPRPPVTLNFEAGRFGGHGGCNGYGAEYRIEGRRIVIGLIGSTLVGCSGTPVGDVEQRFFQGIGGAFEISHRRGQSLTILRDGRPVLVLAPDS